MLFYGYGFQIPGGEFVRAKRGAEKSAPLLLAPQADAMLKMLTLPANSEFYLTALGFDSDDLETANQFGDFYLDIDSKTNPEQALTDARAVLDTILKSIPSAAVRIWYSGCKGFHITVNADMMGVTPLPDLHLTYKLLAKEMSTAAGVSTLDLVIYERVRLWRQENTWNAKGERFKIPLSIDELRILDLEQIRTLAKTRRTMPAAPDDADDEITEAEQERARKPFAWACAALQAEKARAVRDYDPSKFPPLPKTARIPCIDMLTQEKLREGEGRNRALWVAAAFMQQQKVTEDHLADFTVRLNAGFDPPLADREVKAILRSLRENGGHVGCRTPELSSRCPGRARCWYFTEFTPTEETAEKGVEITDTPGGGFSMVMSDGWQFLVTGMPHVTAKGMTVGFKMMGADGTSKVASLNIAAVTPRQNFLRTLPKEIRPIIDAHLDTLAGYLTERHQQSAVATDAPETEDEAVIERDGCYKARKQGRDGSVSYQTISNFTIEIIRLLYELAETGDAVCTREVRLRHNQGGVTPLLYLGPGEMASTLAFVTWCNSAGNFSFTGSTADLQNFKEKYVMGYTGEADTAWVVNHIGWIDPRVVEDTFLARNLGVSQKTLVTPNDGGVYQLQGKNIQLRGVDTGDRSGMKFAPVFNTDFLDRPDDLQKVKVDILRRLFHNLHDYRGWLMLGMAYAGLMLPEIVDRYNQFPGLYLVGPYSAGKDTMLHWMLGALGMPGYCVLNLPSTTVSALDRHIAYYSGLPLVLNEFRNTVHTDNLVHMLRGWYDRSGRSISSRSAENKTISRPIRGWMVLAGQDISQDAAFNSRFVTLVLEGKHYSRDQKLKREIDLLMRGPASAISLDILLHKDDAMVERMLGNIGKKQQSFQEKLEGNANERIAYNYAVALSGWLLAFGNPPVLDQDEVEAFSGWLMQQIRLRHDEQREGSEALSFLRDIPSMLSNGKIHPGIHMDISENVTFTCADRTERFVKRALWVWLKGTHDEWTRWKHMAREGVFSENGLTYALRSEQVYVGTCSRLFTKSEIRHPAMCFDLNELDKSLGGEWANSIKPDGYEPLNYTDTEKQ